IGDSLRSLTYWHCSHARPVESLQEAHFQGVALPQLADPRLEFLLSPRSRGEVPQVSQQRDGLVVILRPLRVDQRLHAAPDLRLPPAEVLQVRAASSGLLPLAAGLLGGPPLGLPATPLRGALLGGREESARRAPTRRSGHRLRAFRR